MCNVFVLALFEAALDVRSQVTWTHGSQLWVIGVVSDAHDGSELGLGEWTSTLDAMCVPDATFQSAAVAV